MKTTIKGSTKQVFDEERPVSVTIPNEATINKMFSNIPYPMRGFLMAGARAYRMEILKRIKK